MINKLFNLVYTLLTIWSICYVITRLIIFIDEKTHNCTYKSSIKDEINLFLFWWIFVIIYIFGLIDVSFNQYAKLKGVKTNGIKKNGSTKSKHRR